MAISLLMPDGLALTAQQERQAKAPQHGGGSGRPLGGRSGFRVGTPSNILTATSTTWTLGACAIEIDPGASVDQGMYGWANSSNFTGTGAQGVQAADQNYDRKDIVYIQINDPTSGDGTASLSYAPQYLAGTASASPTAPDVPPRSFLVGTITVPKAGGGSPTVQRNPAVYVAAGAPLPVSSQVERDALTLYNGLQVLRMDVPGRPVETYDGAAWFKDEAIGWNSLGNWTTPNGTISRRWNGQKWEVNFLGFLVLSADVPFSLGTGMAVIGTAVPDGWRPALGTVYGTGAYSNNFAVYQAPIVARIDPSGVLSVATVTGSVGIVQNCQFFINISWTY